MLTIYKTRCEALFIQDFTSNGNGDILAQKGEGTVEERSETL